jgi:hypothetical protein
MLCLVFDPIDTVLMDVVGWILFLVDNWTPIWYIKIA